MNTYIRQIAGVLLTLIVSTVKLVGSDTSTIVIHDNGSTFFHQYRNPHISEQFIEKIQQMRKEEADNTRESNPYVLTLVMAAYMQTDTNGIVQRISISPLLDVGNHLKAGDTIWTECLQMIEEVSRFWKVKPAFWFLEMLKTHGDMAICRETMKAALARSFVLTIVLTFPPYNAPEFNLDESGCNMPLKISVNERLKE